MHWRDHIHADAKVLAGFAFAAESLQDESLYALTPSHPAEVVLGLEQVPGLRIENRYTVVEPPRIRQRPLP